MDTYYPNTYYANIHEQFKRRDGTPSYYSTINQNVTVRIGEPVYIKNKAELKTKIEEIVNKWTDIQTFAVKETKHGWEYERFMISADDPDVDLYEIGTKDNHTDHEKYIVDVLFFEDVDIMDRLNRNERFDALIAEREVNACNDSKDETFTNENTN